VIFLNNNAIIFSEGAFGTLDGKTAHGLVRYSQKYKIVGVIDSLKKGYDSGELLDGRPNGIKIYGSLQEALNKIKKPVQYFIYGIAPNSPFLPREHRKIIFEAIHNRMNIVVGLMNFLSEDSRIREEAKEYAVQITDVRKPPTLRKLHMFTNEISHVDIPVIAVLGTDAAVGKRTTAIILNIALRKIGINSEFVATGQTGLMQGAKYGVALDAIPDDFLPGEVENAVISAYKNAQPDIIIIEGQSALLHPAFIGSFAIMKGARPDGIIIAHAPSRKTYCDYPEISILDVQNEINIIETISKAITFGRYQKPFTPKKRTLGIAINHENMTKAEVKKTIKKYEKRFNIPATDPLLFGVEKFVEKIKQTFFEENKKDKM
jgi:uncharacterized NAD-dependent epimerase/dehydratase family protein